MTAPLFARALGPAFDRLPPVVRRFHDVTARHEWRGEAEVLRGTGLLARLIAAAMGFPPAGRVPLTLVLERAGEGESAGESWTRDFGGHVLRSRLSPAGQGRVTERFGPSAVLLEPRVADGGLDLPSPGARLLGIPVPRLLAPVSESIEREADGRFLFDVKGTVPLAGLVVHYRGWLEPV